MAKKKSQDLFGFGDMFGFDVGFGGGDFDKAYKESNPNQVLQMTSDLAQATMGVMFGVYAVNAVGRLID